MIKSIVKSLAKKYVLAAIQEIVSARADKFSYWSGVVGMWIMYAEKAIALLRDIAEKLSDGKLTDKEADEIIDKAAAIIKEV